MSERKCSRCGLVKPIDEFVSNKTKPLGKGYHCKSCEIKRKKKYLDDNPGIMSEISARWRKNNPLYHADYRQKNPEKERARIAKWNADNAERARETSKIRAKRFRSTPRGKLNDAISSGVRRGLLIGSKQGRRSFSLIGYTSEQLSKHLERQFAPGMTWDNYGTHWHVDHKIPLSAHNYETPDDIDFKNAWALSNLQPMWSEDNMKKGAKLYSVFQPSLALAIPSNDNRKKTEVAA